MQQKILWAEVQRRPGGGRGGGRSGICWPMGDLFFIHYSHATYQIMARLADGRCEWAVLDFLTSTDVGRLVPPEEETDAVSELLEAEIREWEEEQGAETEEPGAGGGGLPLFLSTPDFIASAGEE